MTMDSMKPSARSTEDEHFLFADWFDPLEIGVRTRIRGFIEELLEAELDAALGRARYERGRVKVEGSPKGGVGSRHGHRERSLLGTFGATTVCVPRAAGAYLSGTNTRRVRRALAALFGGAVGKDTVSRVWRKTKGDWDAWNARALKEEPIVRLILDGTVARVRLDKKATSISLLVALGVRADGQKVLLAIKNMGGESEAAWRALLDNLVSRGLRTPELVIVDGGSGLDKALAALWPEAPVQRCTVHKHRNLLAHAPDRLHEEVSADYNDMIYAATSKDIEAKRFPPSQWKSIRTTNAIERLHEEFKRRIKTQTVLPSAETAAMLFWALLASGQIIMRKVDGWASLAEKPSDQIIDLAA